CEPAKPFERGKRSARPGKRQAALEHERWQARRREELRREQQEQRRLAEERRVHSLEMSRTRLLEVAQTWAVARNAEAFSSSLSESQRRSRVKTERPFSPGSSRRVSPWGA